MEKATIGLHKKIVNVMKSITSISKDGFNAFHKYKYVTDAAIVTEIRKELIENNLVVIPSQENIDVSGELTILKIKYSLIDADSGERQESYVYGAGHDKGDKGVYKAATGAEKYYLLKTFLLPTDDDPENEKESKEADELENTNVRVPAGYWDLPIDKRQERLGKGNVARKTEKGWFIFAPKGEAGKWKEDMNFSQPPLGEKK